VGWRGSLKAERDAHYTRIEWVRSTVRVATRVNEAEGGRGAPSLYGVKAGDNG
jgi:hypothetical protein